MILALFVLFFSISLLMLFYGAYNDDSTFLVMGFAFLLIPAWSLAGVNVPLITDNPGVQYTNGSTQTYAYATNTTIDAITTSNSYATYHNRTFGFALLIVAVMGMWMAITGLNNTGNDARAMPRINWRFYR